MASPLPSHETYEGRLSIPYRNKAGVVWMQFRCLQEHTCKAEGHPKYLNPPNTAKLLYGVLDLDTERAGTIHVTEGALDRLILSEVLQEPVVGCPDAETFEPHWVSHFKGFDRVLIWADGDHAGRAMASNWVKKIGAEVVNMPHGEDVNSVYLSKGADGLRELAGGEEDDDFQNTD